MEHLLPGIFYNYLCIFMYLQLIFLYSPKDYKQVYSIHVWSHNQMFPCAHFVLKDKSEQAYDEMLNELNNKAQQLNFSLKPQRVTGDYEHAAINAFKNIYESKFEGCLLKRKASNVYKHESFS